MTTKKKTKKKGKKIWIIGIIATLFLVAVISYFVFLGPVQETSYFYDEDLGVIETKTTIYSRWNKWMKLFEQAAMFAQTTADVGDTISLTDTYTVIGLTVVDTSDPVCAVGVCKLGISDIYINNPLGQSILIKTSFPEAIDWDTITVTTSFTAINEGTYSATTYYYESLCNFFTPGLCQSTYCCQNSWLEPSDNTVVVSAPIPVCGKTPYWDNWGTFSSISNGYIEKRTYYIVDSNCNYVEDNIEYRTFCDTGYQITGTSGNSVGDGQLTCELIPIVPECTVDADCTAQICENQVCVNYECNADVIITCSDNSTVTTQTCTNYRLNPTGNVCLVVDVCDDTHLSLCTTESECVGISKYWYNNICNADAEVIGDVCDATHLSLCVESNCTDASGYWYNNACNVDAETTPECTGTENKCDGENYYTCESEVFVVQGKVDGECGYVAADDSCPTENEEDCFGEILYKCEEGQWINKGRVDGKCGYSSAGDNGATVGGCGTVTPGLEDECCQNLGYDYWDDVKLICKNDRESSGDDDEPGFNWLLTVIIIGIAIVAAIIVTIIVVRYVRGKKKK